jgi:signal transduction histidine kinase
MFREEGALIIVYYDDGIGFDVDKIPMNHGIKNINSRLRFMNGSMDIESSPGKTIFRINVPLA